MSLLAEKLQSFYPFVGNFNNIFKYKILSIKMYIGKKEIGNYGYNNDQINSLESK